MSDFCIATGVFRFGPGRSAFSFFILSCIGVGGGHRAILAQKWIPVTRFTILILIVFILILLAIGQAGSGRLAD